MTWQGVKRAISGLHSELLLTDKGQWQLALNINEHNIINNKQCVFVHVGPSGSFWAWSVKILVILNPTGYILTSSGVVFIHLRYILLEIPLK